MSREEAAEKLGAMKASMAHRGPDGQGEYFSYEDGLALGHLRLAIIDPNLGAQPMANEDGSIQLIFNGCIYNYVDIMRVLRQKGHHFRTNSDSEVIVHAYEEWGEECVRSFNGMWAFAIWDGREKKLFCSRDRLGIKPFYYRHLDDSFYFASEIKAILAGKSLKPAMDMDGLRQYLTFQFCLGPQTLFKEIRRLEPGHNLVLRPGGPPRITKYWDVSFNIDFEHDEDYYVRKLVALLEDGVRLRLRSDVPLGGHLSGGLDSSAILAISKNQLGNLPFDTFTGTFSEGKEFDETPYARLAAEQSGANYHQITINSAQFMEHIQKIIWHMDEPAAGPGVFPQYCVSELAAKHVKVVLNGQGGDEIFIGYARYLVAYLEECIKGAIEGTAKRGDYVATLQTIVPNLRELQNYTPMLKSFWSRGLFDAPERRYFRLMNRFADSRAVLNPELEMDEEETLAEFSVIFNNQDAKAMINRIMYFDLKTHLQGLLQVEDRTSMAHGLESRAPLLDYRLTELMASIPPNIKFKNGHLKHLFRQGIKGMVPPDIYGRNDKMGFPVPLNQWFKQDLGDFARDVLLSGSARSKDLFKPKALEKELEGASRFSRGLWGALCLELWMQAFMPAI